MLKTKESHLEQARSTNGGWSKQQLSILGISWPPKKGWKKQVIGKEINERKLAKFISLTDNHLELD